MRTEIYITENHFFPFNIRIWTDFPLMPRKEDTIKDYIDIEYYMLSDQEKREISKDQFEKHSHYLSDLTVTSNVWWCKDHIGPYCTLFVECQ